MGELARQSEREVYRVMYIGELHGRWVTRISDLIFRGREPIVVLDWGAQPRGKAPLVMQPLDPKQLQKNAEKEIDFLYFGSIVDPRKRS